MESRLILLRQRIAAAIHAAVGTHGEELAPALTARVEPFLEEGETPFDFLLLLRVLARMIRASLATLVSADEAHLDELTNDVVARSLRDSLVVAVRQKLIDVRQIVQGLFGSERAVEIVPLDGPTASQPEHLWRQGRHTLHRLEAPGLTLPEPSTGGVTFDPAPLAGELRPLVTGLRSALDAVAKDRREAEASLKVKDEAKAEHDLLMGACGRILTGFFLLGNRTDLVRRVRISARSSGRSAGDGTGGEPPSPEASPPEAPTPAEPADGEPATD